VEVRLTPSIVKSGPVKRITYVGTSVLVDDEFGGLVLEYAAALARRDTSETITFQAVNEHDLREVEVSFIVGPASEIVVERLPDETSAKAPENSELMSRIQERIAALDGGRAPGRHTVIPEARGEASPLMDGLDI
jgi:hypothetical protein